MTIFGNGVADANTVADAVADSRNENLSSNLIVSSPPCSNSAKKIT